MTGRTPFDGSRFWPFLAASLLLAVGCGDGGGGFDDDQPEPPDGATSFVSAASDVFAQDDRYGAPSDAAGGEGDDGRTVEEGDIFRLLGDGMLLNLNAYRGVQVIDYSDLAAPVVVGAIRIGGTPVEGYVLGDRAVVLLNHWYGYYGSRFMADMMPENVGLVLLVDLSDPSSPAIVDHEAVSGNLMTSRLTRGASGDALYVAAQRWDNVYDGWGVADGGGAVEVDPEPASGAPDQVGSGEAAASADHTVVVSIEVTEDGLEPRTELDLGGWITDIQATTDALLVARFDWSEGQQSDVAIIDISDPTGTMVQGADVGVAGYVESQFNMDLRGDVLRVVSGDRWGGDDTNHVETFDVSDIDAPTPIASATFGQGEDLYATLFVGNKAFFVTYFRVDPFHAFEITDEGEIFERSEFVVSGWNDFFRTAFGDERLVGVGIDDADERWRLSVSLYDITDLTLAEPLIDREDVELEHSWSEATWDHRAFTVIDDAVEVEGPEGEDETGLVLLPFQGWSDGGYVGGVQLFTYSPDSLTRRGVMAHSSPVRRSFVADEDTAGNLSDIDLGFYDIASVDDPIELSRLDLAPSFSEVWVFGDHVARLRNTTDYSWYAGDGESAAWTVEIVAPGADPDSAPAVAAFDVPAGAWVAQVGDRLVSVAMRYDWEAAEDERYMAHVDVYDLSVPSAPALVGSLDTSELRPGYYYGYGPEMDCWDCGWYWRYSYLNADIVDDALVFTSARTESEPAGTREVCVTWADGSYGEGVEPTEPGEPVPGSDASPDRPGDWPDTGGPGGDPVDPADGNGSDDERPDDGETYYVGWVECVTEPGGHEVCNGQIYECEWFEENCRPVDHREIDVQTRCETYDVMRYWQRYSLQALDVSDPAAPVVHDPIDLPRGDDGVATMADADTVWVSFRRPHDVRDDDRPYVKYFVRPVDFADPANPVLGDEINVPGVLLAIDGTSLFTWDAVYSGELVESALSRLELREDGLAELKARRRFDDRQVDTMMLDGAGNALVCHRRSWRAVDGWGNGDRIEELSVLDTETLVERATVGLDTWASLRHAEVGRALLQTPGGLLVLNLDDPTDPVPQAWFATIGWPARIVVHDRVILFAASRYGIYRFGLDDTNLLDGP